MQGPIPIESRALGTLAYIRSSIESSGSMAVPGMAGFVMGMIGIVACILASLPRGANHWLSIWLLAAAIAFAVGGAMMAREAAHGCAVLSASTVTIARTMRLICIMGAMFMVLGALAFVSPPSFHTLILGMGFGGLHTIFGILIGQVSHAD